MRMYGLFVEGISDLREYNSLDENIRLDAARAINQTAERGRTSGARMIRDQVKFPARYLDPSGRRFYVSKKATRNDLEAKITARSRPTSLARFTTGTQRVNKPGVRVEISPGRATFMRRAFLVQLPGGRGPVDTINNLGLAVRLRPGDTLRNKHDMVKLDRGLYLLYGPSIDQVFRARDGTGVADDLVPELEDRLERDFLRLVGLRRYG